ncbi:hypothetical protein D1007_40750 [Hordeum vulgare]|nr:hypothetical protein D1007_40750 [Hordeum vulgare]
MEENEVGHPSPGMNKAKAQFTIAHAQEMAGQETILDSVRDEAKVEANHRLIRQRQAKVHALFDELDTEETAAEKPEVTEGKESWMRPRIL